MIDAADQLGLGWDDVAEKSEGEVYLALFPGRGVRESVFAQPDWVQVHRELARVGVTLKLLHQEYHRRPFQKREGSRLSVFTTEEKPLLQPLPAVTFEISTWTYGRKVSRNGHVVWAKNFYSVPFTHIGAHVDLRVTDTMLEIYRGSERLTSHLLLPVTMTNQYRTNEADLPEGHSWQAWDRARIDAWALRLGPATGTVIEKIFESVRIEEAGYDPALAVLRLSRRFSPARVEAACQLALRGPIRSPRYAHLRPILDTGQDKTGHVEEPDADDGGGYVRGSSYYAGGTR